MKSEFEEIGEQLIGKTIEVVVTHHFGTNIFFTDGTTLEMPDDNGRRCGYKFGIVESDR
jgi:hypothetical protein